MRRLLTAIVLSAAAVIGAAAPAMAATGPSEPALKLGPAHSRLCAGYTGTAAAGTVVRLVPCAHAPRWVPQMNGVLRLAGTRYAATPNRAGAVILAAPSAMSKWTIGKGDTIVSVPLTAAHHRPWVLTARRPAGTSLRVEARNQATAGQVWMFRTG